MNRRTNLKSQPRQTRAAAAERYMRILREDHAGLSRVLREIDAQQSSLQSTPGSARPVLAEALHYLLAYQHSIHHPREDRLFARVRAREPRLYANMDRLVREHRIGQEVAARLARELSRATLSQLQGATGRLLASRLHRYVQRTRDHMRREEAVFYTGSERVLRASDWKALLSGPMPRDPVSEPQRFAARFPRLAERISRPERTVTGPREAATSADLAVQLERAVESCAALLHEAIDAAQRVARASVRSASRLRRAARGSR